MKPFTRIGDKLVIDMEEPNYKTAASWQNKIEAYNSRPSYPINPSDLKEFEEGKQYELNVHFEVRKHELELPPTAFPIHKPEQNTMELPGHIKQKIEGYAKEYTPKDIQLMERICSYYQEFFEQEIKERDEEIKGYQKVIGLKNDEVEIHRQEIERLKALIEEGYKLVNREWKKSEMGIVKGWQQFKTENNL
jgi:hypothetical protein